MNYFFRGEDITGCRVYQHEGNQEKEENFQEIIKSTDNVEISSINFYHDDHREYRNTGDSDGFHAANFIQLADLVAGATSKLYTKDFLPPRKENLAFKLRDAIKEGKDGYNKFADISFFPDSKWEGEGKTFEFYEKNMQR